MKLFICFFALIVVAMCEDFEDCFDIGSDCSGKTGEDCVDEEVYSKCAKTCHLCGDCEDSRPDCDWYKKDCDKMDDRFCRKTCLKC